MEQNDKHPLVAIKCLVYNQEAYLRDCFEGFVMQQTNFPFVAVVHDDASTDKSADIIREYTTKYPDIFRPIYETENQYSKFDGSLGRIIDAALEATGAKYIANCDGDDYWCDPLKLQKQFDCLEQREDFGVVNTAGWRLSDGKLSVSADGEYSAEGDVREWCNYGPIGLASSTFFETKLLRYVDRDTWGKHGFLMGDYPMLAIWAHHTKFAYIADRCVVYRATPNSMSKNASFDKRIRFELSKIDVERYLRDLYPDELGEVFSDEKLADAAAYLRLRQAIFHFRYAEAKQQKSLLVTAQYKRKKFSRFFRGPISFALLAAYMKFKA